MRGGDPLLACLQWTSAACIVNNSRFLTLPWVRVKGLASKILARCARQLPDDWERRYGCRPLLLETLADPRRFAGARCRAAD